MAHYSGHYLLDLMSEEDQQKFKFNFEVARSEYEELANEIAITLEELLDEKYESFEQFIAGSFRWSGSPEGHDYWSDLNIEMKTKTLFYGK